MVNNMRNETKRQLNEIFGRAIAEDRAEREEVQKSLRSWANYVKPSELVEYMQSRETVVQMVEVEAGHIFAPYEIVAMLIQRNVSNNLKPKQIDAADVVRFRNYFKQYDVANMLAHSVEEYGHGQALQIIADEMGRDVWKCELVAKYMTPDSSEDVGALAALSEIYRHGEHLNGVAERLLGM